MFLNKNKRWLTSIVISFVKQVSISEQGSLALTVTIYSNE